METVSTTIRKWAEFEETELNKLRSRVTKLDKIRSGRIRGTAHVGQFGSQAREARLKCFGFVRRRNECVEKTMLEMYPRGRKEDQREGLWMEGKRICV